MKAQKLNRPIQIQILIVIFYFIFVGCNKKDDPVPDEPKQISHFGWHDSMEGEIIFTNIVAWHNWWDIEDKIFIINKEEAKCFVDNHCSLNWIGGLDVSPDASKLVIAEYSCMYILNIAGSDTLMLTDYQCNDPSWSFDGSLIAFKTYYENVRIINYSTGNYQDYSPESEYIYSPAWSPVELKIAFIEQFLNDAGNHKICIMDIPSGIIEVIADGAGSVLEWSPNGDKIFFEAYEQSDRLIKSINLNGSGLNQLINFNDYNLGYDCVISDIEFSPNGEMVAVTSNNGDLFILNLNGTIITEFKGEISLNYRCLEWIN